MQTDIIYSWTFISWPLTSRILIEMSKWIESPCYIVIVLNMYLNLYYICTKILEYWKDFLVRSSLRWWTLIVCVIKTKWHKQTEKSWYNIIVTHNCNSKNHLHRHIFPRSKMICQRSRSLSSYMLIHHHQKSPVLRHISTRLSWMLRFNTDWF